MAKPVPTFDKICQIATSIFATHGYDAASLKMIVDEVGIRKASLYSHFPSKNELFHKVFMDAYAIENAFMQNCYTQSDDFNDVFKNYCLVLPERFEASIYLQFFLRVSFISPDFLKKEIKASYENYLKEIGEYFLLSLRKTYTTLGATETAILCEAYLGIIDSLHIELIYSDINSYEKKCNAMINVFSKAIIGMITSS